MITIKEVEMTWGKVKLPVCDCEQYKNSTSCWCEHVNEWFNKNRNNIPMQIIKYLYQEKRVK
jgi:hypothetical protein